MSRRVLGRGKLVGKERGQFKALPYKEDGSLDERKSYFFRRQQIEKKSDDDDELLGLTGVIVYRTGPGYGLPFFIVEQ